MTVQETVNYVLLGFLIIGVFWMICGSTIQSWCRRLNLNLDELVPVDDHNELIIAALQDFDFEGSEKAIAEYAAPTILSLPLSTNRPYIIGLSIESREISIRIEERIEFFQRGIDQLSARIWSFDEDLHNQPVLRTTLNVTMATFTPNEAWDKLFIGDTPVWFNKEKNFLWLQQPIDANDNMTCCDCIGYEEGVFAFAR